MRRSVALSSPPRRSPPRGRQRDTALPVRERLEVLSVKSSPPRTSSSPLIATRRAPPSHLVATLPRRGVDLGDDLAARPALGRMVYDAPAPAARDCPLEPVRGLRLRPCRHDGQLLCGVRIDPAPPGVERRYAADLYVFFGTDHPAAASVAAANAELARLQLPQGRHRTGTPPVCPVPTGALYTTLSPSAGPPGTREDRVRRPSPITRGKPHGGQTRSDGRRLLEPRLSTSGGRSLELQAACLPWRARRSSTRAAGSRAALHVPPPNHGPLRAARGRRSVRSAARRGQEPIRPRAGELSRVIAALGARERGEQGASRAGAVGVLRPFHSSPSSARWSAPHGLNKDRVVEAPIVVRLARAPGRGALPCWRQPQLFQQEDELRDVIPARRSSTPPSSPSSFAIAGAPQARSARSGRRVARRVQPAASPGVLRQHPAVRVLLPELGLDPRSCRSTSHRSQVVFVAADGLG